MLDNGRSKKAVGGTLHNVLYGKLDVDFHTSLLENKELLERVAVKNAELNGGTGERGRTYFLSQVFCKHHLMIRSRQPHCA